MSASGDGAGAGVAPGDGPGAAPNPIGATPTIVPFSLLGMGAGGAITGASGAAGGGTEAGRGGAAAAGAPAGGAMPGWFIMSMVPLNLGAAAPLIANEHRVHAVAVSEFSVPQF